MQSAAWSVQQNSDGQLLSTSFPQLRKNPGRTRTGAEILVHIDKDWFWDLPPTGVKNKRLHPTYLPKRAHPASKAGEGHGIQRCAVAKTAG
jgi:hypothetical protein